MTELSKVRHHGPPTGSIGWVSSLNVFLSRGLYTGGGTLGRRMTGRAHSLVLTSCFSPYDSRMRPKSEGDGVWGLGDLLRSIETGKGEFPSVNVDAKSSPVKRDVNARRGSVH